MKVWRREADLYIDPNAQCRGRNDVFGNSNRLVAHLRANSDMFHKYTLRYLQELYKDWYPDSTRHKGLEVENTKQYYDAKKREQGQQDLKLRRMKAKIEEMTEREREQEQVRKQLEELTKTHANLVQIHEAKVQAHKELLSMLGVDPEHPTDSVPPSSDDMFDLCKKKYYNCFWKRINRRFGIVNDKSNDRCIRVDQDFCLQECFEKWSAAKATGQFPSILFQKELNARDVKRLLSTWKIDYAAHKAFERSDKAFRKNMASKDEGGPEVQFFAEVWRMLPSLEVSLPDGSKRVRLFEPIENHSTSYVPTKDEKFDYIFRGEALESVMKEKARCFYRAVGRLFVHCMCSGRHHIPRGVLPKLLCNAVLRDCRPTDRRYLERDIADHLMGLGWNQTAIMQAKEDMANNAEIRFRDIVDEYQIKSRQIWFESFREGLMVIDNKTKEEYVPLSDILFLMPLECMDRLIFATQDFSPEDLFSSLHPEYDRHDIALQQKQKTVFEALGGKDGILQAWFKDDRSKLHKFLQFCTGQPYLPDWKSNFKITVTFETSTVEGNASSDDRLPESHTCIATLSLPKMAYNGDVNVFEKRLAYAIQFCKTFDQN